MDHLKSLYWPSVGPHQPLPVSDVLALEGQPRAQHIWEGAHQIVVKRNGGGRLFLS